MLRKRLLGVVPKRVSVYVPILLKFITGQTLLQLLNLINGFFLLRWLTIEEQAIFAIAFGIQTVLTSFSDMGFSSSIIALTGSEINNRRVVGRFIQSAKQLRLFFFFGGLLISFFLYYLVEKRSEYNIKLWMTLIPVALAAFLQTNTSLYSTPMIMQKKMNALYKPQVISSSIKILINCCLFFFHSISALSSLIVNTLLLWVNGLVFKKVSHSYFDGSIPQEDINSSRKKMLKYLAPMVPGLLFYTFYGQLQIFIVSFFGKTQNIAEVAALGRLSQIFAFFNAGVSVIVAPIIAQSNSESLLKKYMLFGALAFLLCLFFWITSFLFPNIYLFLLGNKYSHLKSEVSVMILNGGIAFASTLYWVMNCARRWIFWWSSWMEIVLIVACQFCGIIWFDLSSTKNVLFLTLFTSLVVLLVHCSVSIFGFLKQRHFNS